MGIFNCVCKTQNERKQTNLLGYSEIIIIQSVEVRSRIILIIVLFKKKKIIVNHYKFTYLYMYVIYGVCLSNVIISIDSNAVSIYVLRTSRNSFMNINFSVNVFTNLDVSAGLNFNVLPRNG